MTPKRPKALPKISMIRILTKVSGVCASAMAQLLPVTPTQTPQTKLDMPTYMPNVKRLKPHHRAWLYLVSLSMTLPPSLPTIMIPMMTP